MSKKRTPTFLTTKNGNFLHFIPLGTHLSEGTKFTEKDQWIYTDKKGTYLMSKYEETKGKPINHVEWDFLKNKAGLKIQETSKNFFPRLATALVARELFIAKKAKTATS